LADAKAGPASRGWALPEKRGDLAITPEKAVRGRNPARVPPQLP